MNESQKFIDELTLPLPKSDAPSVYAFSLHKSGSTLLFNMLSELSKKLDYEYFSIQDKMFEYGIPPKESLKNTEELFSDKGYVYGGFRFFPKNYSIGEYSKYKSILLVRNPLDALVSMYFSAKSSHKIPKSGILKNIWLKKREETQKQSIDEFVIASAEAHKERVMSYTELLGSECCRLFRYEDIIYDKAEFLRDIADHYAWDVPTNILSEIAKKHDIFPGTEKSSEHVRQVHPGNFKKNLQPETITYLQEIYKDVLEAFGYNPSAQSAFLRLISSQNV